MAEHYSQNGLPETEDIVFVVMVISEVRLSRKQGSRHSRFTSLRAAMTDKCSSSQYIKCICERKHAAYNYSRPQQMQHQQHRKPDK